MSDKRKREDQAFEALFVSSMRSIDNEDVDIGRIYDPSQKEQAALELVGPELTNELVGGKGHSGTASQPPTRWEPEMHSDKPKHSGGFVVAVSLAIVALVVAPLWWSRSSQPRTEVAVIDEGPLVEVPVVASDLPAGRVIRQGDIRMEQLSQAELERRGFALAEVMTAPMQIVGREMQRPVKAGSPFLTSYVFLSSGGRRYQVESGMRAVQVRIAEDRGGAQVAKHDHVDLYFTSKPQPAAEGRPEIPEKTLTVAERVKVLSVDYPQTNVEWAVGHKAKSPIFALEVDPDTAGKIVTLKDYGDFAALVRAGDEPTDRSGVEGEYSVLALLGIEEPSRSEQTPSWTLETYHRRGRTAETFPAHPGVEAIADAGPVRLFDNDHDGIQIRGWLSGGVYHHGRSPANGVGFEQHWGYRPVPAARPTANLNLAFSNDDFTTGVPQFGGFDPTQVPQEEGTWGNIWNLGYEVVPERVREDSPVAELEGRINELFPQSKVNLTVAGGKLNVSGRVANQEEAAQILSIVSSEQVDESGNILGRGSNTNLGTTTRPFLEAAELEVGVIALVAGPAEGESGQRFDRISENNFKTTSDHPLSTFSIDVDTASYSKTRQYLQSEQLPPPDAVRIEELVNYFPYDYLPPMGAEPFTAHMEVSECPWKPEHRLARIAIKGQVMEVEDRPHSNLVFLLDVSGSMNQANKLPLAKKGMKMLVERLGEKDRVAIVTYAGNAGLVLDSTSCDEKAAIMKAIDDLQPGGSTAGAAGIKLAYEIARKHFIEKGVNRVLLCTDGDFNVGVSDDGGLVRLAEEQAKHNVFLSILGFGSDNLNDSMLEQVSGKANGMYAFIDTENEARKVLVEQLSGTLVTIAKDVKIQIEFNPAKVKGYRLIGYENRMLAAEDFNDDTKDAGEIGAGHNVTALYEIVPTDAKVEVDAADVDDLKYQKPSVLTEAADSEELLTLKLRFKQPDGDKSSLMSFPIDDDTQRFSEASGDFQFAAAVASFGMLLRGSRYAGDTSYDAVHEIATAALGDDEWGYRKEFVELVAKAKELTK